MGENFIHPKIIIVLALKYGWTATSSVNGGSHVTHFSKEGHRTVPMRNKIKGRIEAQIILKQLEIPKKDWPGKVK